MKSGTAAAAAAAASGGEGGYDDAAFDDGRLGFGKMGHGCQHYRRRCSIRAPCCNEIFSCRHCHNESTSDMHELQRRDVQKVVCLVCDTEQQAAQVCSNCGVNMGEYYCDVCKFYDDDISKGQYHCDECGICRVGGKDKFFHCQKCGSCYSVDLLDNHSCVENSMRHHCPICYEYLFDSMRETRVLRCGHTLHAECLTEMVNHSQYTCPICSKSMLDMSRVWRKLDEEVEATLMPADYRDTKPSTSSVPPSGHAEEIFHLQSMIDDLQRESSYRASDQASSLLFGMHGFRSWSCRYRLLLATWDLLVSLLRRGLLRLPSLLRSSNPHWRLVQLQRLPS